MAPQPKNALPLAASDRSSDPGYPADNTPLVRPHRLTDETALPTFSVPPSHVWAGDRDPLHSFPSHFKFFVLRSLGNTCVSELLLF